MSPTERIEEADIEAVLERERTPNHELGKIVLENTTLYNEQFLQGLHYDSEGRYIDGSW